MERLLSQLEERYKHYREFYCKVVDEEIERLRNELNFRLVIEDKLVHECLVNPSKKNLVDLKTAFAVHRDGIPPRVTALIIDVNSTLTRLIGGE